MEIVNSGGGATNQPQWSDPNLAKEYWWISTGSFKDRNPYDYAAIAASSHDVCKGFMALLSDRQYIDLKGSVGTLIDALIAVGQPVASPYLTGSGPMTTAKKLAWLTIPTTEYERHIKGMVQPV